MISFDIGQSGQSISFSNTVLAHFDRHRQARFWRREAGGLLFARLALPLIDVCAVTGPRRTDRRGRYSYWPDRKAEQREIQQMFAQDLHFVGCWHTHPEDEASPSQTDIRNTNECVRRSHHALNGFIMVIAGRVQVPAGMYVCVCDATAVYPLASSVAVKNVAGV